MVISETKYKVVPSLRYVVHKPPAAHTHCVCIAGGMCWGVAQCSVVCSLLALCAAAAAATDAHVYNRHRSCRQVHSVCALPNDVLHVTPYIASQPDLCCNGYAL